MKTIIKGILGGGVLVLALLGPPNSQAQTTGKISGTIRSAKDHTPLPGADVIIERTVLGASASRTGRFLIEKVPAGV
ncbi:MAG: carboxypeptidase-like regulatory domain-containing protein, partial [Calditrichaeota bacterium]|nr:carboxypeptidase-like regulatory domain-containing protein [Calditrichota bacterium]